jgi:hypothetical protein
MSLIAELTHLTPHNLNTTAAVERAQAPTKARGEIEAWVGSVLERLRQLLQALQTGLETTAALQGRVAVLADKQRRQESILRLDRDIASLEAEFKAFEERAKKDKGRLTNRKATSVGLLKEEQFRKGSQARARSLLARLKQELTEWVGREGAPFDASLLGADLQQLFQVAQESGGDWERARTELMHLCTQAPLGPGGVKQRRRSSPSAQLSPEMPRVSPTPSTASSTGDPAAEAAPDEASQHQHHHQQPLSSSSSSSSSAVSAASAPASAGPAKRDPFARVLSPSDALGTSASTSGSSASGSSASGSSSSNGVGGSGVPLPVAVAGMAGFPGLNRLANAGTLSDMLVRGTSIPVSSERKPTGARKDGGGPTKENVAKNE